MRETFDIQATREKFAELLAGARADGDTEAVAILTRMENAIERFDSAFNSGRKAEAMAILLPYVQMLARRLPPVSSFAFLFTYRLTMLARNFREAINV